MAAVEASPDASLERTLAMQAGGPICRLMCSNNLECLKMRSQQQSTELFRRGRTLIPDGVSSPMRAFAQVGGHPIVAASGKGCRVTDVDGNQYVDFLNCFGALLLGHAREEIVAALTAQVALGTAYGLSSALEYDLAEKIVGSSRSIDQVRFVCSGTEAVMTAARIARAHTGRSLLVKFGGAYHGHSDALLASPLNLQPAGTKTKGLTAGIAEHLHRDVLMCDYNDLEQLEQIFRLHGNKIAAVLVEPYATNMGFVKPLPGFHQRIRELCDTNGALFIFDEVVTGFRFRFGPVCDQMGIDPDLITFGKIIGGGAPIGAYAGKSQFMQRVAAGQGVFQSGTFAANPLTMAAGNAALDVLAQPGFYERLESNGAHFQAALQTEFAAQGIGYHVTRHGALTGVAFRDSATPLTSYKDVKTQDYEIFPLVHRQMLERGFLIAPSLEEPLFMSAAHTPVELSAAARALADSIVTARGQLQTAQARSA